MEIRDELVALVATGSVRTESILPADLPPVSPGERKWMDIDIRSTATNRALLAAEQVRRELLDERKREIAHINSLHKCAGGHDGLIRFGSELARTLERLSLISARLELVQSECARLEAIWQPLGRLKDEMRWILDSRPRPIPENHHPSFPERPMLGDYHHGLSGVNITGVAPSGPASFVSSQGVSPGESRQFTSAKPGARAKHAQVKSSTAGRNNGN